jgi:hypothetical protein
MAKIKCPLIFVFSILSVIAFADSPVDDPSVFSGVWLESYPGQEYDPIRAAYITIHRIGSEFLMLNTSMRRPGGAGVLQWTGEHLVSSTDNEVNYRILEDNQDVLFVEFSGQGPEGPRIVRYIRYSEGELNLLKETMRR